MHESWIPGNSFLHRWDARYKLAGTVLLCFLAAALSGLTRPLILTVLALVVLVLSRLPLADLFRRLGVLHLFFVPCFLLVPFSTPGEPLVTIGPLVATMEGFVFTTALYLRALAITSLAMALVLTTPIDQIVHAAERLRAPRVLTQITLIGYRFLFAFRADWRRIRNALKTRGFRNATRMHAYRTVANAMGGLLLRAFERTDRVTRAMRCRGYRGSMPSMREFHAKRSDGLALLACVLVCSLFLGWEFWR